jgi:hypothetical protein
MKILLDDILVVVKIGTTISPHAAFRNVYGGALTHSPLFRPLSMARCPWEGEGFASKPVLLRRLM